MISPTPKDQQEKAEPTLDAPLHVGHATFGRGVKISTAQACIDRQMDELKLYRDKDQNVLIMREAMKKLQAEIYEKCDTCNGSGLQSNFYNGEPEDCHKCKGNTVVPALTRTEARTVDVEALVKEISVELEISEYDVRPVLKFLHAQGHLHPQPPEEKCGGCGGGGHVPYGQGDQPCLVCKGSGKKKSLIQDLAALERARDEIPPTGNDMKTQKDVYIWYQIHEKTIRALLDATISQKKGVVA